MALNSGWLLVDKHKGITSRNIVNIISKCLKEKKVGHAGTLDPMATGLLAVAIGEATKSISVIQGLNKVYEFKLKWGVATDTDDSTGSVISKSKIRPTKEDIIQVLPKFIGTLNQVPPAYSAIKINGIRSYKLARQNEFIEHKPRMIEIFNFRLQDYIDEDYSTFEVVCSKGTFVRSLARDIGKKLNTEAHIVDLRRTFIGNFSVENAILLDLSEKLIHSPLILRNIIPLGDVLRVLPSINLTKEEADKIKHGQKLSIKSLKHFKKFLEDYPKHKSTKTLYCCSNDLPIAFIEIHKNEIRPFKVFNV